MAGFGIKDDIVEKGLAASQIERLGCFTNRFWIGNDKSACHRVGLLGTWITLRLMAARVMFLMSIDGDRWKSEMYLSAFAWFACFVRACAHIVQTFGGEGQRRTGESSLSM
jgi:hypothetical protein